MLVGLHQFLVLLLLHLLEHLLIIRQAFLIDHFSDFSLDPSSDHSINRILLSLDSLQFWFFLD